MCNVIRLLLLGTIVSVAHSQTSQDTPALQLLTSTWSFVPALSPWYVNSSTSQSPCTWLGLVCDPKTNRVAQIKLEGYGISGTLNEHILDLPFLRILDLKGNNFTGSIPAFGSLLSGQVANTQMELLDLRDNHFSGSIPDSMQSLSLLASLNLSSNNLSGQIPAGLSKFDCSSFLDNPELSLSSCNNGSSALSASPSSGSNQTTTVIIVSTVGALFVIVAIVLLVLYCRARSMAASPQGLELSDLQNVIAPTQFRRFSYKELSRATKDFSASSMVGEGGASQVFRGDIAGHQVAVKRLDFHGSFRGKTKQFENELQFFSRPIHRHILPLTGYCADVGHPPCIVMPYLPNGSMAAHLRSSLGSPPPMDALDWPTRRRAALGVGQGLAYLHEEIDPAIIHGDIKSANILLDENLRAYISDFGLARDAGPPGESTRSTKLLGTLGFMAPEYFQGGRVSEKLDVFAFGVFLLELVSGCIASCLVKSPHKVDLNLHLRDWVLHLMEQDRLSEHLIDAHLQQVDTESDAQQMQIRHFVQVAVQCMTPDPSERPTMSRCVTLLEQSEEGSASRSVVRAVDSRAQDVLHSDRFDDSHVSFPASFSSFDSQNKPSFGTIASFSVR